MTSLPLILKYKVLDDFNDAYHEKHGKDFFGNAGFVKSIDDVAKEYDSLYINKTLNPKFQKFNFYGKNKLFAIFSSAKTKNDIPSVKAQLEAELNDTKIFDNLGELSGRGPNFTNAIRGALLLQITSQEIVLKDKLDTRSPKVIGTIARDKQIALFKKDASQIDIFSLTGTYAGNEAERFSTAVTKYNDSFDALSEFLEKYKGKQTSSVSGATKVKGAADGNFLEEDIQDGKTVNLERKGLVTYKKEVTAQISELDALLQTATDTSDKIKISGLKSRVEVQSSIINRLLTDNDVILNDDVEQLSHRTLSIAQGNGDQPYSAVTKTKDKVFDILPSISLTSVGTFFTNVWDTAVDLITPSYVNQVAASLAEKFIGDKKTVEDKYGILIGDKNAIRKNYDGNLLSGAGVDLLKTWASAAIIGKGMRSIGKQLSRSNNKFLKNSGNVLTTIGEVLGYVSKNGVKFGKKQIIPSLGRASTQSKILRDEALAASKIAAKDGDIALAEAERLKAMGLDHSGIVKKFKDLFGFTKRNRAFADNQLRIAAAKAKEAHAAAKSAYLADNSQATEEVLHATKTTFDQTKAEMDVLGWKVALKDAKKTLKKYSKAQNSPDFQRDTETAEALVNVGKKELKKAEKEAARILNGTPNTAGISEHVTKPIPWYNPRKYLPERLGGLSKAEKAQQASLKQTLALKKEYDAQTVAFQAATRGSVEETVKQFEVLFTKKIAYSTLFKKEMNFFTRMFVPRRNDFETYKISVNKYIENLKKTRPDDAFVNNLETAMASKLNQMQQWATKDAFAFRSNGLGGKRGIDFNLSNIGANLYQNLIPTSSFGNIWTGTTIYGFFSDFFSSKRDAYAAKATGFDAWTYAIKRGFVHALEFRFTIAMVSPMLKQYTGGFDIVEESKKWMGLSDHTGAFEDKNIAEALKQRKKQEIKKMELDKKAASLKDEEFRKVVISRIDPSRYNLNDPKVIEYVNTQIIEMRDAYTKDLDAKIAKAMSDQIGDAKVLANNEKIETINIRIASYFELYKVEIQKALKDVKTREEAETNLEKLKQDIKDNPENPVSEKDAERLIIMIKQSFQQQQGAEQPAEGEQPTQQ